MTSAEARAFADRWAADWNRRDTEAVLASFDENVVFTSPTALAVVGEATLRGKEAIRSYWATALARIPSLRFTVERTLWDPETLELAIIYTSEIGGEAKRVSENLRFDEHDRVIAAEVFHGVARRADA